LAPVVHGLEQRWSGQVTFVYLDIDDPRTNEFKREFGYVVQPHIFLLDGEGDVLEQWIGYVEEAELESALAAAVR
jgi:thioredoxin-related protein